MPAPFERPLRPLIAALALLALVAPAAAQDAAPDVGPDAPFLDHAELVGVWEGEIGPGSLGLAVVVEFELVGGDAFTGTIDIPAQGSTDLPLAILSLERGALAFAIEGVPGDPTFRGALDGDRIEGTFTQGGQEIPFALARSSAEEVAAAQRRPQDPVPPFPYQETELTWEGPAGTLAGSLVVPEGEGPFPAVLMITGSGAQDRDESLMGHRPFLVIADALARAGVASLRVDDRGVGGSEGSLESATYDDLVADARTGLAILRGRPEVDPGRVGLLGHSEGGYLAPMIADRAGGDVAFTVLLAAPAVDGAEVLRLQNRLLYELADAPEAVIEDQVAYIEALAEALRAGDPDAAAELVRAQVREQIAALPEEQRPSPEAIEAQTELQASSVGSPYFREFVLHDPQPYLRRLDVPTLALYGGLDIQVPAVQSAGRMSGALRVAGNPDFEVATLPGLNHLLQPARTGGVEEYAATETTIAPEALERITGWIAERFVR